MGDEEWGVEELNLRSRGDLTRKIFVRISFYDEFLD